MPGLAATRKTSMEIAIKMGGSGRLYLVLVTLNIIINIENGKNTEPRYEIRFAQRAKLKFGDMDKSVYPILTTKTDEKSDINQCRFLRTNKRQPTNKNNETRVATP